MNCPNLKKLAEDAKQNSTLSSDAAFEMIIEGIAKMETHFQMMIDSIMAMQDEWPMPKAGWRQFVDDVQRTNERYGFNLQIKAAE